MPPIAIHISWQYILYYPITGYVAMDILSVVGDLMQQQWGGVETPFMSAVEYDWYAPEWWYFTSLVPPKSITS